MRLSCPDLDCEPLIGRITWIWPASINDLRDLDDQGKLADKSQVSTTVSIAIQFQKAMIDWFLHIIHTKCGKILRGHGTNSPQTMGPEQATPFSWYTSPYR
jgi:hypothetical protein